MSSKSFAESKGLLLRKIGWIAWLLFFIPVVAISSLIVTISNAVYERDNPPVSIVSTEIVEIDHYTYTNKTHITVRVTFSEPVRSGATVDFSFYDSNHNFVSSESIYMMHVYTGPYSDDDRVMEDYIWVSGQVYHVKVDGFSGVKPIAQAERQIKQGALFNNLILWSSLRCFYIVPLLLTALFFNCKSYTVDGHSVVVFAGRMRHYIKLDGVLLDEKNSLIAFIPVSLSSVTPEGTVLEAYASGFIKRISLKVNHVLQQPDR